MKLTIYTAIFGKSDTLHEPSYTNKNIKYVCFTDNDFTSDVWDIKRKEIIAKDGRRESRRYKMLSHKYINTKISLYLDGNWYIHKNPIPYIKPLLKKGNWVVRPHGGRDCIYAEAKKVHNKLHTNPQQIKTQMRRYKKDGYPKHNGLVNNTVILRRKTRKVRQLEKLWWKEYQQGSCRDQLCFNYVAWKHNLPFVSTDKFKWKNFIEKSKYPHRRE